MVADAEVAHLYQITSVCTPHADNPNLDSGGLPRSPAQAAMSDATGSVSTTGGKGTQCTRGEGGHVVDIQVATHADTPGAVPSGEVRAGQNPAMLLWRCYLLYSP